MDCQKNISPQGDENTMSHANEEEDSQWGGGKVVHSPLCPLLKIGVLTVQEEHELTQLEQSSTTERRNQIFSFQPRHIKHLMMMAFGLIRNAIRC